MCGRHQNSGVHYILSVTYFRFKFFVFSAFYDRREENIIRVVGATKTRGPEPVWCRLWYRNGTSTTYSVSVLAKVKVSYLAGNVLCVCLQQECVLFSRLLFLSCISLSGYKGELESQIQCVLYPVSLTTKPLCAPHCVYCQSAETTTSQPPAGP